MKELVKKIVVLFFILCLIFSTIDISVFQTFASEVEKITEQQSSKDEIPNEKESASTKKVEVTEEKTEESDEEKAKYNTEKEENNEKNLGEEIQENSKENEQGKNKEKNQNKILLTKNEAAVSDEDDKSKDNNEIDEISNEENDFTYYYEGSESEKTNCNSEGLNNAIKENKGNLIIELNKDISIDPSYNGEKIQAAIVFADSSYTHTLNLNNHTITASSSGYNIIYAENTNLTIKNGTITGANSKGAFGTKIKANGGGLYGKNSEITINSVTFTNNVATNGGAIYCEEGSNLTIYGSTFSNNEIISSGGGVYFSTNGNSINSLKIENSNFNNNKASAGGGLYVEGKSNSNAAEITLKTCTFSGNNATTSGMGIHLSNHFSLDADNVKVINNGNINQQNKGALVFTQNSYSYENKAKIKDSEISGNATNGSALVNRAAGFTIEGYSYDITLDNTVIKNNIGKYVGGLSINGQTQSSKKIKFTMNSGAIFGNSAKEEYSDGIFPNDVYVENNATVKIPSINKMAENESSIANYYWNNYSSSNGYKFNSLGQDTGINLSSSTSSKNIYNVSEFGIRNIAKINEQKYTTLKDAFDKVQNGETIVFIAGEDDNSGTKIPESITYSGNKNITIDLNGKQWEGSSKAAKALTINGTGNGPNITIKGEGSISDMSFLGGSLKISSNVKIDNLTLGEGKKIEATEDFGFKDKITIEVNSKDLAKLENEDITIINNSTGRDLSEAMSNITIKDASADVVLKIDDNGNIVLHKLKGVYVGNSGLDTNSGDDSSHPVKTFGVALERAMEKINSGVEIDKIFVVDTIQVSGKEEWNVPENTNLSLCRYKSSVRNIVEVNKNGELTLNGVIMDGMKDTMNVSTALALIDEDGTLNIEKGTILKNNNSSAVDCRGNLNMNSGEISENSASNGAGVYVSGWGSMVLDGDAIIKNNKATDGGGGIALTGYYGLVMNGGTISNNTAGYAGGGVSVGDLSTPHRSTFTMNDGTITENSTTSAGGGIFVQASCSTTITKGNITNNSCSALNDPYGGGGIYVNGPRMEYPSGVLTIPTTAYISENKSSSADGAGIAGCSTSKVIVYDGGASVFNNNLQDGKVAKNVSQIYVNKEEGYGSDNQNSSEAYISKYAIGGVQNHWTDEDGNNLSKNDLKLTNDTNSEGKVEDDGKILKVRNDNANLAALTKTKSKASVIITGNESKQKGGGIGTNGEIYIGDEDEEYEISMEVTKTWEDENNRFGIRPDKITVNLYANGEFLKSQEVTEADGWKYTFTELPKYDDNGELINYTISEVKVEGYETTIDGTNIINTHHEEKEPPEKITLQKMIKLQQEEIKPPKTGGILEDQSVEQKEIVLPITSQVLPIMLLAIVFINSFRLIRRKNRKK